MPSSQYRYAIVEPHPTVTPAQSYVHSGRGGAGNAHRVPATVTRGSDASGPASRASLMSLNKPRTTSFTGRGGAGNARDGERAIFSFDEELQRQMNLEKNIAPVYHVGRGGAGNFAQGRNTQAHFQSTNNAVRRDSDTISAGSTSSSESGADIATRKFKSGFKKIAKIGI